MHLWCIQKGAPCLNVPISSSDDNDASVILLSPSNENKYDISMNTCEPLTPMESPTTQSSQPIITPLIHVELEQDREKTEERRKSEEMDLSASRLTTIVPSAISVTPIKPLPESWVSAWKTSTSPRPKSSPMKLPPLPPKSPSSQYTLSQFLQHHLNHPILPLA